MVISILVFGISGAGADEEMEMLKQNQTISDFAVENVYLNETEQAMGARFRHKPSGFVLDLLRIQSIPQAFLWVNSFPPSDQGEPHTCEHLLLGKGTKGRYVASLEDMSLTGSSALPCNCKPSIILIPARESRHFMTFSRPNWTP
jgi:hypothetical protein